MKPDYCKKYGCEVWSFNKNDCEKYGMKFGDTYYFNIEKLSNTSDKPICDLFFIGVDKPGRIEMMNNIERYCTSNGFVTDINLTVNPERKADSIYNYSPRMRYDEVIEYIINSKTILDLNQPSQSGLSLRPLEALLLKKKLITNNQSIIKYRAYDKNNTFILKKNDFDGLAEFLSSPYIESDSDLFDFYRFESWLNRICNNIEAY